MSSTLNKSVALSVTNSIKSNFTQSVFDLPSIVNIFQALGFNTRLFDICNADHNEQQKIRITVTCNKSGQRCILEKVNEEEAACCCVNSGCDSIPDGYILEATPDEQNELIPKLDEGKMLAIKSTMDRLFRLIGADDVLFPEKGTDFVNGMSVQACLNKDEALCCVSQDIEPIMEETECVTRISNGMDIAEAAIIHNENNSGSEASGYDQKHFNAITSSACITNGIDNTTDITEVAIIHNENNSGSEASVAEKCFEQMHLNPTTSTDSPFRYRSLDTLTSKTSETGDELPEPGALIPKIVVGATEEMVHSASNSSIPEDNKKPKGLLMTTKAASLIKSASQQLIEAIKLMESNTPQKSHPTRLGEKLISASKNIKKLVCTNRTESMTTLKQRSSPNLPVLINKARGVPIPKKLVKSSGSLDVPDRVQVKKSTKLRVTSAQASAPIRRTDTKKTVGEISQPRVATRHIPVNSKKIVELKSKGAR